MNIAFLCTRSYLQEQGTALCLFNCILLALQPPISSYHHRVELKQIWLLPKFKLTNKQTTKPPQNPNPQNQTKLAALFHGRKKKRVIEKTNYTIPRALNKQTNQPSNQPTNKNPMLQGSWLSACDPEICSHMLSSMATPDRCSWDILNKMLNKNISLTVSALKSCSLLINCQGDCQQHSASNRTNIKTTRVFTFILGSKSF